MKKRELADLLAEKSQIEKVRAAEEVDRLVHRIVRSLRKGQKAELPGLGSFLPGKTTGFRFEAKAKRDGKTPR
jgi:Bacterial nucleoid DNA-binding protein